MSYDRDIDAISTWERGERPNPYPSTGNRREPEAVCYTCGAEVEDGPRFGREATCDDCARAGRGPVVPWLVGVWTR